VANQLDPKQGKQLHLLEEYAADVTTIMARTEMKVGEHLENAEALMVWWLTKGGVKARYSTRNNFVVQFSNVFLRSQPFFMYFLQSSLDVLMWWTKTKLTAEVRVNMVHLWWWRVGIVKKESCMKV
jgi:hypothetical protein